MKHHINTYFIPFYKIPIEGIFFCVQTKNYVRLTEDNPSLSLRQSNNAVIDYFFAVMEVFCCHFTWMSLSHVEDRFRMFCVVQSCVCLMNGLQQSD